VGRAGDRPGRVGPDRQGAGGGPGPAGAERAQPGGELVVDVAAVVTVQVGGFGDDEAGDPFGDRPAGQQVERGGQLVA
jgi:hypothetical protein